MQKRRLFFGKETRSLHGTQLFLFYKGKTGSLQWRIFYFLAASILYFQN